MRYLIPFVLTVCSLLASAQTSRPATTNPTTRPLPPKVVSLLTAIDMPEDIGVQRGQLLCVANFNLWRDPKTAVRDWSKSCPVGQDWWRDRYSPRLLEMLKDVPYGGVVSMNYEGAEPWAYYGPDKDDASNERVLKTIGEHMQWVRSVRPDVWIDWNTSPMVLRRNAWRYPDEAIKMDWNTRMRFINRMIAKHVVPYINSFSTQCYFNRNWEDLDNVLFGQVRDPLLQPAGTPTNGDFLIFDKDGKPLDKDGVKIPFTLDVNKKMVLQSDKPGQQPRKQAWYKEGRPVFWPLGEQRTYRGLIDPQYADWGGWVDLVRSTHEGYSGFGIPVCVMFNPAYEWRSKKELNVYGKWITGDDLKAVHKYLASYGMPVLLWGGGTGPEVELEPGFSVRKWDPNTPEMKDWINYKNN